MWKVIEQYPKYSVSELGEIKSNVTNRILKLDTNYNGYKRFLAKIDGKNKLFFVHRAVALHFVDGYFDGAVVNHKDGNKSNNHYTNLEWVSRSDNNKHAIKNKLSKLDFAKRPVFINDEKGTKTYYESVCECARQIGVEERRLHHLIRYRNGYIKELNKYIEYAPNDYPFIGVQ